jgi:Mrp family chromosome partitioning ATPase
VTIARAQPEASVLVSPHELGRPVRYPRLVLALEPDGPTAGAFRVLQQRLLSQDDPRRILVTSPRPGDGKTMCAVNLAIAYAERGFCRPVVLEGNLRRPELARMFGFEPPVCFARQLIDHRIDPMQQWSLVHVEPLDILVAAVDPRRGPRAGPPRVDPALFAFALRQLQLAGFGPIIIDGPPVLDGAEANLLLEACEGALLAARANQSRARDVQASVDQLLPGHLFGVVLIDL